MERASMFYLIFILTIIAIRAGVYFFPENKLKISGTIIHHFWIGILLIGIAILLASFGYRWVLLSAGLALAADELVYMLLGAGSVLNYWSIYSVAGAILNSTVVFILRNKLVNL
jgi:hypothetical protein